MGIGCPACADRGFNPTAPGVLYLVHFSAHNLLKIGVTTAVAQSDRISQHEKRGWKKKAVWDVETGDEAVRLENAVLAWWKLEKCRFAGRHDVPENDGYTESIFIESITPDDVIEYVERHLNDGTRR